MTESPFWVYCSFNLNRMKQLGCESTLKGDKEPPVQLNGASTLCLLRVKLTLIHGFCSFVLAVIKSLVWTKQLHQDHL